MDPFAIDHVLVAYVVACVAAFRKYIPKIDGLYVPLFALLVATLFCVLYAAQKPDVSVGAIAAAVLMAFKVTVAAVGGVEMVQYGASKLGEAMGAAK